MQHKTAGLNKLEAEGSRRNKPVLETGFKSTQQVGCLHYRVKLSGKEFNEQTLFQIRNCNLIRFLFSIFVRLVSIFFMKFN